MKQCSKCNETKPFAEYHKDIKGKYGYVAQCKSCVKIKSKQWYWNNRSRELTKSSQRYAANPELYRQRAKEWADANREYKRANDRAYQKNNLDKYRMTSQRRKARKRQNGIFKISSKELQRLYSSPCTYCGSTLNIQADHVIPIARGGRHSIGNLVPACQKCNSSKRQRFITEWKRGATRR